ncbi:MAG: lipopolysaccharide biosynthesis protein [Deltaproteobacteria bacterium]|nr:lipopolysaccharide biosynthesis protein [Deltaproteobacteria bacterium]
MSRFTKNIAQLVGGNAASQVVVFGATPLLTRLFSPEDFGVYAVFSGSNAVLAALFTLKYDLAILLPKEDVEARGITRLMLYVAATLAGAVALGLVAWGAALHALPPWQYLFLPASGLLAALVAAFQQWSARAADYRRYSKSLLVAALVMATTSCALGVALPVTAAGLPLGFVLGQAAAVAYLWLAVRPRLVAPHVEDLRGVAGDYRRFPLFVLPSALLALLATSVPPWLVERMFSLHDAGQYALAARMLITPSALVGFAIAEAFRAELMARLHRREAVTRWVLATLGKSVVVATIALAALAAVAPYAFGLVFGEAFRPAGELLLLLAPAALAQFVLLPMSFVFVATDHVRLGTAAQALGSLLPLALLAAGGHAGSLTQAFTGYSAGSVAAAGAVVLLVWRTCRAADRTRHYAP